MRKKVIFIQLTKSTSFALHKIDYKVMWTTRSLLQENILHKHEKKNNSMKLLDWTNCNYIFYRFIALFVHFHCLLGNVQQLLCGSTSSNELRATV